ncbi:osmotic avoidance abnormal protein 3-like [Osmia bicornis bicornis]|uniref:osmotic avoidance abnormal protein 3-like n=1 Tax=Osmia bicornis bicornis TaxID=1437191 RepID=UPI001EAEAB72|nr:osmotic avoidance abnormal protein 3-like [Osmia bicornis bicornis]
MERRGKKGSWRSETNFFYFQMSESVKVAVRCRPMNARELQQGCRNVITIDSPSKCCTLEGPTGGTGSGKVYQFDAAIGPEASTETVYENVGSVIVEAVLDGYNGTVFAYGQTGCGKSHTMRGFIERTLDHIFEATSTASSEMRYLALLSYLEIYNERLRDLLQDGIGDLLTLKEDPSRGTYVAGGLREVTVKDAAECARLVEQGDRRRAAAATKMNAASSRSHAVLTLSLETLAINDDSKTENTVKRGRLHLVDLAGSERQARTGATGDRLKEAASINLSLSALGNVISALAAGQGRHVPYRDSKLTRLLRDSLGGNARTLMIACVSPSDADAEETLSTLRYAARARCIKNKPVINEDPKDALLRQYQLELQRLKKMLESNDQTIVKEIISSVKDETDDEETRMQREEVEYAEEVERLKKECEDSNLSAQKLREELEALKIHYEAGAIKTVSPKPVPPPSMDEQDLEREERRRKKREAAMQEVLKRLEKLTIGGEEQGNTELRRRREKRRKKLEALASALESSAQEGNGSVFQVYGQLRSTEDALKRMAKRVKQLEAEAADLQASWDAERRDLLRRELLTSQICDSMVPHLRPGCPLRDVAAVRAAATWCDELGRWRLPDVSPHIPLPPPSLVPKDNTPYTIVPSKPDLNNNSKDNEDEIGNEADNEESSEQEDTKKLDIVDTYFRRSRIDKLLAHVRQAKTFELNNRISKSGGSEDCIPIGAGHLQLNALNLQTSTPVIGEMDNYKPSQNLPTGRTSRPGWMAEENSLNKSSFHNQTVKKHPPRILEALPSYPQSALKFENKSISDRISDKISSRFNEVADNRSMVGQTGSPMY